MIDRMRTSVMSESISRWASGRLTRLMASACEPETLVPCQLCWDGLRLLEEEQQRRQAVIDGLRGEIEKGRRSGKPKPAAEVLDRLERKYSKMVKERAK
jgi:hypothetical protein